MEYDLLSTEIVKQGVADSGPYAGSQSFHVRVRRRMPNFLNSVNLNHVRLGYHYLVNHKIYLLTAPVLAISLILGAARITTSATPPDDLWSMYGVAKLAFLSGVLFLTTYTYLDLHPRPTYLVDFVCYSPPRHLQITRSEFIELAEKSGQFNAEAIEFQHRVLGNSGIGDESYMPRTVFSPGKRIILQEGREEAAMVMFGAVDHLLATTKIKATDIKILVVNCGVLNTTPSLSAMIINHYKLGCDINSYNLGGMGCAAGAIAVDLARDLLTSHTASSSLGLGAHALVVSTEIVSSTWYGGNDLDMLMPNCYFRMGAAALLLSNKHLDRWRAKYELKQVVRTHKGGSMDDRSFRCVELTEDRQGKMGLRFLQDKHRLFEIGGQALKANMTTLGPLVLPVWEQLLFFKTLVFGNSKLKGGPYIPNYKLAFEHVCIQASSKMVLDEVQRNLELTEEYMEASRRTLERFGNTSSSSVWYELAFLEAHEKVKRGDRIWQVALGSGFKCTSVVWKALRKTKPGSNTSPWI